MLPVDIDNNTKREDIYLEGAYYVEIIRINDYDVYNYINKHQKKFKKMYLDSFTDVEINLSNILLTCEMEWKQIYRFAINETPNIFTKEDLVKATKTSK